MGQGASGDVPESTQDPRGGARQGHMGTKAHSKTTVASRPPTPLWHQGPGIPEEAGSGGTWRSPPAVLGASGGGRQTGGVW